MFPISSASLTTPADVAPVADSAAVAPVRSDQVAAAGSATDAPAAASVTVDLSPVANFLLTVSQSQEQLTQLQTALANGAQPREAAASLNDTTQNVVNAFNLLPSVDFNQPQPQGPSLLNNLVQDLNATAAPQSAAQRLARIGVTLQAPLLSDATGGLSLDNEVLRAAFNTDQQATTQTLQNTLDSFGAVARRFAEQLSAAGSSAAETPTAGQQPTPADMAANARLDLARAELGQLAQQSDPLRANPALAAAIAAYHINDTGANAHTVPAAADAIPRVPAVEAAARIRALGNTGGQV